MSYDNVSDCNKQAVPSVGGCGPALKEWDARTKLAAAADSNSASGLVYGLKARRAVLEQRRLEIIQNLDIVDSLLNVLAD